MTKWLLAAEADKIQDYIFRSSRLAQVVGGSGLLSRFCREVPGIILEHRSPAFPGVVPEVIIADGGHFLICFDDAQGAQGTGKAMAEQVGYDLAGAYYRTTDASLTVAQPQAYEESSGFAKASKDANGSLRLAKADRREAVVTSAQLPYTAICESCGISLAGAYAKRFDRADEVGMLLCPACQRKGAERNLFVTEPEREQFLNRFHEALRSTRSWSQLPEQLKQRLSVTQGKHFADFLPFDASDVGQYDPRNYVAYIVADGNSMGVLFSQCQTPQQLRKLSEALNTVMWQALAEATVQLLSLIHISEPTRPY